MQVTQKNLSDTKVQITAIADAELLASTKQEVLRALAKSAKLPGFRPGKAPIAMVEKNVNPETLQSEFLDRAVNKLYGAVLDEGNVRPVAQPKLSLTKFVPFNTLEIELEVDVVGNLQLADYRKIKLAKANVKVTDKDVNEVLANLRLRAAEKKDVDRAAKGGDQTWIDFTGIDAKTKEPIKGADGQNYPLVIGSNTFIPGFEPELIGLKAGDEKTFTIIFPSDYGVKDLQKRKVSFTVTVSKVQEVVEPTLDNDFAKKVGPFKNLDELKADIKKQLQHEKEAESNRAYADELVMKITEKSKMVLPEVLITEQIDRLVREQKQNLTYRGQTWQEFLDGEGLTEEQHKDKLRPDAERRIKAGLVLSEIAEKEKLKVTRQEIEARIEALKKQYSDPAMQAELDKPENRRDIASRILTDKTVDLLVRLGVA